ncbi:MAG: sulfate reduction electron transfer complex DsrMKJOP subunit DsrJ [Planctomycetota bacterium]|jgi:hypothetical protein
MSDKVKISLGLAVFLLLAAFPIWNRLFAAGGVTAPELELPENEFRCVEATEHMTANHMDLLNEWRDLVVRPVDKKTYVMSLTGTCMGCHTSRENFCTRCHDYANVAPTCWNCHVEPRGN